MKKLLSILTLFIVAALFVTSCDDFSDLPIDNGQNNTNNGNNNDDDATDDDGKDDNDDGKDDNDDGTDDGTDDDGNDDDGNDDGSNDDGTGDGTGDDGNNGGNDDSTNDGNYKDSELTPGEHQERLEKIAIDFIGYFNTSDVESIVNATYNLAEYMEDWEYDVVEEDVVESDSTVEFETSYTESETRASVKALFGHIARGAQNFSSAEFTRFATRAAEEFIIDPDDEENIWSGKCFTYEDYEWVESDIAKRNIKFVWDNVVAQLTWDDTTAYEYLYDEDNVNYVVKVPSNIKFTLKIGGKEHVGVLVETNIKNINVWAPSVTVKLNGGYELGASVEADRKGIVTESYIKKNNKKIFSELATIAINDSTDIDNWFYSYYCDECEDTHTYIDPSYYFAENAKTGTAQIDILNLSIVASGNFKGMYEFVVDLEDKYDWYDEYDGTYYPDEEKNYCNELRDYVNEKVEVVLVYNDTKDKVADIVLQTSRYYDDYYEDYCYYIEPILLFPDGSKFAFEEYFTERAFGDLIDKAEEFAGMCEDLLQ